jgi:hypothetical protein
MWNFNILIGCTSKQASLARHLSEAGFDTWILEVRGAGLSKREGEPTSSELGGTDGAFSGAVQEAFVQATIKNATQATENRDEDAAKKVETILERQSNPLAKLDEPLTEEDTVASRMTNSITQMSQTLRSYVNEVQTSVLISKFIEQVNLFCTYMWQCQSLKFIFRILLVPLLLSYSGNKHFIHVKKD